MAILPGPCLDHQAVDGEVVAMVEGGEEKRQGLSSVDHFVDHEMG